MVKIVIIFITLGVSTKAQCVEKPLMQDLVGPEKAWIGKCQRIKTQYLQKLQKKKIFTKMKPYHIKKLNYHLLTINKFRIPALINYQGIDRFIISGNDVFMYFKSKLNAMGISSSSINFINDYWATKRKISKLGIKLTKEIYQGKLSATLLFYESYLYKPEDIRCSIKSKFQDVRIINALVYDFVVGAESINKVIEIKGDNFKGYMIITKDDFFKERLKADYIIKIILFDNDYRVEVRYSIHSKDILEVYKDAYLIKKMISYKL